LSVFPANARSVAIIEVAGSARERSFSREFVSRPTSTSLNCAGDLKMLTPYPDDSYVTMTYVGSSKIRRRKPVKHIRDGPRGTLPYGKRVNVGQFARSLAGSGFRQWRMPPGTWRADPYEDGKKRSYRNSLSPTRKHSLWQRFWSRIRNTTRGV
jgi:hypothetical protein